MQEETQTEALIARFLSGEASPEEAMQLEDWAEISPENRAYLNTSAKYFIMNMELSTIENRQQVWENIKNAVDKNGAQRGRLFKLPWMSVAAAAVLLLSITLLTYAFFNRQKDETTYEAGAVARTVSLIDKSKIVISPNSSITLDKDYGKTNRKIRLEGSAGFSVIHDAARPFIVDIDHFHIKDLGTKFTVKTSPGGKFYVIGVTEGVVSVYDDSGYSKTLKAGETAIYSLSMKSLHLINIERAKESGLPTEEEYFKAVDAEKKKKAAPESAKADTSVKGYSNKYSTGYPLDKSYTPEGQRELVHRAAETTKRILADMVADGLVEKDAKVSFSISDKGFFINGEKQREEVFRRYEKKYNPGINTNGVWLWTYNANE